MFEYLVSVCTLRAHEYIQGSLNASPNFIYFFKEKDLKQYMDDCGNIMSVHNVKVNPGFCQESVFTV